MVIINQKVLDRIFFVSEKLIVFDGLDDLFEHIIKTSVMLTLSDAATIRVFNMEKGTLDIARVYGLSEEFLYQPPLGVGDGIAGRVVLDGKPFSTADAYELSLCAKEELANIEGVKAIMCVPLKTKDSTIGCITVYKKQADAFADQDLMLLNMFASQAAEALIKINFMKEQQNQTTYDQLTGIYNKNAMLKLFDAQLNLSLRHNQSTSLLLLDIDNFKTFNEVHGHLLGNKLLSDFVGVLKKCCRQSDVLGRFGGDEFVVIASQTTKNNAHALCYKLKESVRKNKFIGSANTNVPLTFSAGISSFPEDGITVGDLIRKADEAMYKSKMAGKNMITLWGNLSNS